MRDDDDVSFVGCRVQRGANQLAQTFLERAARDEVELKAPEPRAASLDPGDHGGIDAFLRRCVEHDLLVHVAKTEMLGDDSTDLLAAGTGRVRDADDEPGHGGTISQPPRR